MDLGIEWMEILMVLGAAVGGVLTVILYLITKNTMSLAVFALGLLGGSILGFFIDKMLNKQKK